MTALCSHSTCLPIPCTATLLGPYQELNRNLSVKVLRSKNELEDIHTKWDGLLFFLQMKLKVIDLIIYRLLACRGVVPLNVRREQLCYRGQEEDNNRIRAVLEADSDFQLHTFKSVLCTASHHRLGKINIPFAAIRSWRPCPNGYFRICWNQISQEKEPLRKMSFKSLIWNAAFETCFFAREGIHFLENIFCIAMQVIENVTKSGRERNCIMYWITSEGNCENWIIEPGIDKPTVCMAPRWGRNC